MKIVYSNFDSIYFAVKGALKPASLEYLRRAKALAEKEEADQPIRVGNYSKGCLLYTSPSPRDRG